jgi:hypothetical protein
MAKRTLRILKRAGGVPTRGVCETCHAEFWADPRQLGQTGVQQQFNTHKCEVVQANDQSNDQGKNPTRATVPAKGTPPKVARK